MVTVIFAVLLLVFVRGHYADRTATRTDFLINLICLPLCWTHTFLVLIFSMRRFSRKQTIPGLIYLAHFFVSACIGFYAYMMINIGWIYAVTH